MPTKPQRLRATAEGFMGGLVACGFRGPWRFSNLDWELAFYQAWRRWLPAQRNPGQFPTFSLTGYPASQGRDMLWQLKRTSAFHNYAEQELPTQPFGLDVRDYLEIHADSASPDEWIALARDFLLTMNGTRDQAEH